MPEARANFVLPVIESTDSERPDHRVSFLCQAQNHNRTFGFLLQRRRTVVFPSSPLESSCTSQSQQLLGHLASGDGAHGACKGSAAPRHRSWSQLEVQGVALVTVTL